MTQNSHTYPTQTILCAKGMQNVSMFTHMLLTVFLPKTADDLAVINTNCNYVCFFFLTHFWPLSFNFTSIYRQKYKQYHTLKMSHQKVRSPSPTVS